MDFLDRLQREGDTRVNPVVGTLDASPDDSFGAAFWFICFGGASIDRRCAPRADAKRGQGRQDGEGDTRPQSGSEAGGDTGRAAEVAVGGEAGDQESDGQLDRFGDRAADDRTERDGETSQPAVDADDHPPFLRRECSRQDRETERHVRAAISSAMLGASAHAAEASVNSAAPGRW